MMFHLTSYAPTKPISLDTRGVSKDHAIRIQPIISEAYETAVQYICINM